MARIKGREVVIDLMDTVAKLEATATKHAELLESLAAHAMSTSAELTAVAGRLSDVSLRVAEVSQRLTEVSQRVGSLALLPIEWVV